MTPPTVTVAPLSEFGGNAGFDTEAIPFARFSPKIVIILPGANDVLLTSEAAFTTRSDSALRLKAQRQKINKSSKTFGDVLRNFFILILTLLQRD